MYVEGDDVWADAPSARKTTSEVEAGCFDSKLFALKNRIIGSGVDCELTEAAIRRFLIGRKYDVDEAFNSILNYALWQKATNAKELTEEDCLNIAKKNFAYLHGNDKVGRPVVYIFIERHDKDDRDIVEMRNFIIFTIESVLKRASQTEEQVALVIDMTNFSMKNMDFECARLLVDMLQSKYPEVSQ